MPASTAQSSNPPPAYLSVIFVLLGTTLAGAIVAAAAGGTLANPVLLQTAITLLVASGMLASVAAAVRARAAPRQPDEAEASVSPIDGEVPSAREDAAGEEPPPSPGAGLVLPIVSARRSMFVVGALIDAAMHWGTSIREPEGRQRVVTLAIATAALAVVYVQASALDVSPLDLQVAAIAAAVCLGGAGLAATAVHYLSGLEPQTFPEAKPLAEGGRVLAWIAALAAVSALLQWLDRRTAITVLSWVVALVNGIICYELFVAVRRQTRDVGRALDLGTLSVLGARTNILGSILDAAERQLGIDLRSTWALTVVRRSVEPLAIALGFIAWLSTALTVIGVAEEGLVERIGVPVQGPALQPGLHLHWPWPIDRVLRLPVQRVQSLTVGHEGQEEAGPENVLWARQHAANEYTLLLGNGRDLITVDAAVQYRIADPRAWQYHSQNPADALRAVAYRAVMRNTVNRTLAEALSENVVTTTARMRAMVQQDADALGLGVEVLGFTVGGMHPPVMVSPDYQSVASAELGKVTAVVNAEVDRNRTVPLAESGAVVGNNAAIAEGELARARATGEASGFLILQSQYGASPADYLFRRRLETLEEALSRRRVTIVDARIQRDGGELWLTP